MAQVSRLLTVASEQRQLMTDDDLVTNSLAWAENESVLGELQELLRELAARVLTN